MIYIQHYNSYVGGITLASDGDALTGLDCGLMDRSILRATLMMRLKRKIFRSLRRPVNGLTFTSADMTRVLSRH